MELASVQNILLTILTSIITGGFVLVFVEIGNRKNRENDSYDQICNLLCINCHHIYVFLVGVESILNIQQY